jgi:polysaccharide export outer membrane protein
VTGFEQGLYVISAGDMLDITVFGVPELAQKTRVSATGDIYMPLVDTVHLAGLNLDEAQKGIEAKLASGKFLKNPHVNITVTEYASGVVIMGEVVKPGIYQVASSSRLFTLLSAAGGTTPNAGKSVTITHRDDPKQETVQLSMDPQLNADANIFVRKGDIVTVSRAGVIYVVGNVVQPSGFLMEGKSEITALKALAMAHGPAKAAALNGSKILRRTPDGVREIPAPLKKIMAAKAPDITLQAEDILYIPNSAGKSAAYRGIDYALSLATGVSIITASR